MDIGASARLIGLSTPAHSFYLAGWRQHCAIVYAPVQSHPCKRALKKKCMHTLRVSPGKPFVHIIRVECSKAKYSFSVRLGHPNGSAQMRLQVGIAAHREGSGFTM